MKKVERIKQLMAEILELDARREHIESELVALVGEDPVMLDPDLVEQSRARRSVQGNLQDRCAAWVNDHADRPWRAREVAAALRTRVDSVASSLVRAHDDRKIDRLARGLYCARGSAKKFAAKGKVGRR